MGSCVHVLFAIPRREFVGVDAHGDPQSMKQEKTNSPFPKTIVFGIKISLNDPIPRRKRGQNFLFKESFLSVSLDKNTTNVL
jgi:hypothetical protein